MAYNWHQSDPFSMHPCCRIFGLIQSEERKNLTQPQNWPSMSRNVSFLTGSDQSSESIFVLATLYASICPSLRCRRNRKDDNTDTRMHCAVHACMAGLPSGFVKPRTSTTLLVKLTGMNAWLLGVDFNVHWFDILLHYIHMVVSRNPASAIYLSQFCRPSVRPNGK
jgi:hypothetical protein